MDALFRKQDIINLEYIYHKNGCVTVCAYAPGNMIVCAGDTTQSDVQTKIQEIKQTNHVTVTYILK